MVSSDLFEEVMTNYGEGAEVSNQCNISKDFCDERAGNLEKHLKILLDEIKGVRSAQDKLLLVLLAGLATLGVNFLLELLKH